MFLKSSVSSIKMVDNKRVFETIKYPKVDKHENDIYIVSKEKDRLDLLSYKYYQDASLWWIIAIANNIHDGSFNITPGIQLRIPYDVDNIIQSFISLNA